MKALSFLSLFFVAASAIGQTSREEVYADLNKAGGVYLAYPVTESQNTPAPEGYEPFFVNHFARHGSRYLIGDQDYKWLIDLFADADARGALTPLGQSTKARLDSLWPEAKGLGGELTPLGWKQHHDIAQRMHRAYPEAFAGEPEITAQSTVVMRCAHSMFAFIEGLKELDPTLSVPRTSGQKMMDVLNYHSPESGPYSSERGEWFQDYKKFKAEKTQPDRLINSLFSDSLYVRRNLDPSDVMWGLYWVAVDMQNMETPVGFYDLFIPDELYDLWEVVNFQFYACNSSYPLADGQHVDNAKNYLRHFLEMADQYIAEGKNGATLRFAHDGNIIPFAALLQIPGCYSYEANPYKLAETYANFKISPMASNLQMVMFRNQKGDVLCKFMLNEREVPIPAETDQFPFYDWKVARPALQKLIDTPSREYIRP